MDDSNLPLQIPVDEDYGDTREVDVDDAESAVSIASTKWNFTVENGRLYHDYRNRYVFPVLDQGSQDNEKYLDALMRCILRNKHFAAPVNGENLGNVLDVASGLGLWTENVADAYPHCHVIGLDTVPRTTFVNNCVFQVTDITQEWVFDNLDIKFDLVHLRNLFATLSDEEWPKLYQQCFEYMKPGAYIEQIEIEIIVHCDDDTKKPDSDIYRLVSFTSAMGKAMNLNFRIAEQMSDLIRATGFDEVEEHWYKCPLGWWSTNPRYREIGTLFELFYRTGLEGWLMIALTRGLQYTPEQVKELCIRALEEIDSREHHYYFYLRVVTARKPVT